MLKNKKLKENGVTLVTLAITIIVLLILAGVSINGIFRDSGIINNAKKAKENTEISSEKELIGQASIIAIAESETEEITVKDMQKAINETTRRENSNSNR